MFEVPELVVEVGENEWLAHSRFGRAAEFLAMAELLERGHKVAQPIVDDDGVDIVVNYGTRVQVKASSQTENGHLVVSLRGWKGTRRDARYAHVDVWMFFDRVTRVFFVIPAGAMPPVTGRVTLTQKYHPWREAWHVFDDALERAA